MTSFAKILIIDPLNDFTHVQGFYGQRYGINQITDAKQKINQILTLYLIEDAIATGDDVQERKEKTLQELAMRGAKIINSTSFSDGL